MLKVTFEERKLERMENVAGANFLSKLSKNSFWCIGTFSKHVNKIRIMYHF